MFKEAAEMFKNNINTLKKHIYVKRKQVNAYHEIEGSLSENDLMLHVDFAEIIKMTSKMLYKAHISELSVLGYLQRVVMLKVLITTILEVIMLPLLPEVLTTIWSRLLIACKKLSTK